MDEQKAIEMKPKAFFKAMLQGLLMAEDPEPVMDTIVDHIQEYGFQRFCEGMDFRGQVDEINQAELLEREDAREFETCGR